ncbi:MAG: type III pantothenate kinase [Gemmatimonas sp.]
MLLVIDCGNTNTVFALFDGDNKKGEWRCQTEPRRTADEHGVWLTQLLSLEGLAAADVKGAVIASVVPTATFALDSLCRRYFAVEPLVVGEPSVKLGLKVLTERPDEVGADRLVNAVAAHARYPGELILIDFGTATTFDAVNADGDYMGGIIAPGVNLSVEALFRAAARLPRISVKRPERVLGTTTISAMQSGVYWGYVGLIEGLIGRLADELAVRPTVIATGGLAALFAGATKSIHHLDPDLTLRGLVRIYGLNQR